ncbi:MAG: tetratricopeptide repeat protein [Alphaproteobacteria bacterium]
MRVLLTFILFYFVCVPARADWSEARTENFILRGDLSEKQAEVIVSELEEYRAIIFKLLQAEPQPEMVPVMIYAVRSVNSVTDITGSAGSAGVYLNTREGPAFVLNTKGSFSSKSPARRIAYHEYTHHLLSTYTNQVFPRWFNEGYAEYLSTFSVSKKGLIKVGLPSNSRAQSLTNHGFMDMNIMTNSIRRYPFRNDDSRNTNEQRYRFYAQSWLAVHYIQSTEGYREKLVTYLQALDQPDTPENVFEESFGITPDAFGDVLKAYYKRNRFLTLGVTLKDGFTLPAVSTRKLTKGETRFHQGEAVRRFRRDKGGIATALEYYDKAEKESGPTVQITASRALMALKNKDDAAAMQYAGEAAAQAPDNSRILQVAGHVYRKTYKDTGGVETKEHLSAARNYLKNAMIANPRNMQAHYDYASTFAEANDKADKQAIYSAGECAFYYRDDNFIESNMRLAEILYRNGRYDEARPLLKRAAAWSQSSSLRRFASKKLEELK